MAAYLISGDEALISLELTSLVDRLVGDNDRSMMVDDFDCAESSVSLASIADAITTMSLFIERKVVVIRHIHSLDAAQSDVLATAIDACIEETDLVMTITGRVPKVIADACKRAKTETIGAAVVNNHKERMEWVEARLIEAGFTYSADATRLITNWFGGDHARVAGLIATLTSAYGEGALTTETSQLTDTPRFGRIRRIDEIAHSREIRSPFHVIVRDHLQSLTP